MSGKTLERHVGDFAFTVALQNKDRPYCAAHDKRWEVLAGVFSAVALDELAYLVCERWGIGKEDLGFGYGPEDELPDGKVEIYRRGDKEWLDRPFFEEAAAEYGLAALELLASAGLPAPQDARTRFADVLARVREQGDGRVVSVERRAGPIVFKVEVARDGWTRAESVGLAHWPLCRALGYLWRESPEAYAAMLETRKGREYAEHYRFTYDDEGVRVYAPDKSETYSLAAFQAAAAELGLAALEGSRALGRAVPDGLEARLRAVRGRI